MKCFLYSIKLVTVLGVVVISADCYTLTDIQRLKEELFVNRKYDKTVRPIFNQSQAIEVEVFMVLTSLFSLDMISGKIIATGYLYTSWTDEKLRWNKSEFSGMDRLTISAKDIWAPKLVQTGGVEDKTEMAPAWISYEGKITWLIENVFKGGCLLDVRKYPFDKHECIFILQPSAHDALELQLKSLKIFSATAILSEHGEWEVIDSNANVVLFTEPISGIVFAAYLQNITLSRRYLFLTIHTIVPCFLLCLLNTVIFVVPLRSGERISFSMTLLLAFVFFTSSISEDLPHNSLQLSYMSTAMAVFNIVTAVGIIASVILCRLDQETITPIPSCLKRITLKYIRYRKGQKSSTETVPPFRTMSAAELNSKEKEKCNFMDNTKTTINDYDEIQWTQVAQMLDYVLFLFNLIFMMIFCTVSAIVLFS